LEESRKIDKEDIVQVTIRDGNVIVRTLDNKGFPVDIWRFNSDNLTHNQKVYRDNILSMAMSMTTEKDEDDEKTI